MIVIDKLCYQSKLRYENAGEKFAFAVAGIVLAVTGTLTVAKGGVPVLRYLKFLTIPLAFLFLSAAAILFHISRTPMDLFAIPLGNWYLTTSMSSLLYAVQLILTALSAVSCLYFLSFTTPITDILEVLLIELMLLIYRFIFVLLDTASAITTSQHCRLGNRDYKTALKSFGLLGSALMLRAVTRSNRLYTAMEARCYDDTIRVLSGTHSPKKSVILAIVLFDSALIALASWSKYLI